jgi:hypothetical protein
VAKYYAGLLGRLPVYPGEALLVKVGLFFSVNKSIT